MKERPLIFNSKMILSILETKKTQTRRRMSENWNPDCKDETTNWGAPGATGLGLSYWKEICPYGQVGDRLWVRETWCCGNDKEFLYRASCPGFISNLAKWRPSIHMPRKASRILLEITNIRVERVQDISKQDCIAEGVKYNEDDNMIIGYPFGVPFFYSDGLHNYNTAKEAYQAIWESIYGKDNWFANPWVWVVEFKVIEVKP